MFMFQISCIRKRETVSYLQYVYDLYFVYQKEGNCIIPTLCLCCGFCVSERGNCVILTICYVLYFVLQKEGNCVMHTLCLWYRFCVSERGKLYHTYNMIMFQILGIRKRGSISYLQYVLDLDIVYQKEGNCIIATTLLRFMRSGYDN